MNLEVLCKIQRFLPTANAGNPRLGPSFLGSVRWPEITMVRELRVEHQGAMKHQGAVYHLVSRGNERERLSFYSENRSRRLEGFTDAVER